jgi:hypothetical protein
MSVTKKIGLKYFDVSVANRGMFLCKLGEKLVSCGGKTAKTSTTSAMHSHMKNKDP